MSNLMNTGEWIDALKSALMEFADPEYQNRVWIRAAGPEVSSYEEAVNRLFDDMDLDGFLSDPRFKDTEAAAVLGELKRSLEGHAAQASINELVPSDEWKLIVSLAQRGSSALEVIDRSVTAR